MASIRISANHFRLISREIPKIKSLKCLRKYRILNCSHVYQRQMSQNTAIYPRGVRISKCGVAMAYSRRMSHLWRWRGAILPMITLWVVVYKSVFDPGITRVGYRRTDTTVNAAITVGIAKGTPEMTHHYPDSKDCRIAIDYYRQVSNIRRTWVGN